MEQEKNQMQKYSQIQCNPKLQNTLDLSKEIISGTANLAVMEMGLTIENTFSEPNIRSVFKKENGQIGYSVVSVLVNRFVSSFGFSTKMSDVQIETLTIDTLDRFAYESLEDVIVFFKMARSGKFGTTNRGVDSNLIFGDWFVKYLEIKSDVREQNYQKEKNKQNSDLVEVSKIDYSKLVTPQKKYDNDKKKIDDFCEGFDRKKLEETIAKWSKNPKWKDYVKILKLKRLDIKQ
jgi:hypothetical protein